MTFLLKMTRFTLFKGVIMNEVQRTNLAQELTELFDMRKARMREVKQKAMEDNETQRDIRSLILMFKDGIPDITVSISETETVKWDASLQKLLYMTSDSTQVLEATSRDIRKRVQPFLIEMVHKAKEFFKA
jgi:hypothetical protein